MSDEKKGMGGGILSGLKRVLFYSESEAAGDAAASDTASSATADGKAGEAPSATGPASGGDVADLREMKLRVYQLLENLNQPGVDFFEVWNAAVEMGGAGAENLQSAYTSLRFADRSLTREKLLQSGEGYLSGLQKVIEQESQKRLAERKRLEEEQAALRTALDTEVQQLEKTIAELQQRLSAKQMERSNLDGRFAPRILEIDAKIALGRQSVEEVASEMRQVLAIIGKELK